MRLLTLNFQTLSGVIGQGLISALLPVIQALNLLMAKLIQAANYFRSFMEFLTGRKISGGTSGVINDTTAGLGGLGDAGNSAAGGMDNATGSAKKLKRALSVLNFDELNKLAEQPESAGGSGGGGGGGGGIGGIGGLDDINFGSLDVEGAASEFYSRLADALKNQRWWEAGQIIGEGINEGLRKLKDFIKWENIGPAITKGVTAITTMFNSIVNALDWTLLGETIGEGINTIVNTLNLLITGINWIELGRSFAEGLNSVFTTVNWQNIGNLIGNKLMIIGDILFGFFSDLKYSEIGKSLANGLNGVFQSLDLGQIGTTLSYALNGLADIITNFTETVRWNDIAKNIYIGLNNAIQKTDWGKLASSLSNFVINFLNSIWTVVENTDWESLGRSIGEFLENIDWWGIFTRVFNIIREILTGLISGLSQTTIGKVALAIVSLAALFKAKTVANSVQTFVNEILSKIIQIPNTINTVINPMTGNAVKTLGGKFSTLGKYGALGAGAVDQLEESVERVQFASDNSDYATLLGALAKMRDSGYFASGAIEDIEAKMMSAQKKRVPFEDAMSYVRVAMEDAGYSAKDFESKLGEAIDSLGPLSVKAEDKSRILGAGLADGTREGMEAQAKEVEESTKGFAQNIIDWFKGILKSNSPSKVFYGIGQDTIQGYINGSESKSGELKNNMTGLAKESVDSFNGIDKKFNSIGTNSVSGLTSGIALNSVKVTTQLSSLLSSMLSKFTGVPTDFREIGLEAMSGIVNGVKVNTSMVTNQMTALLNSVTKKFSNVSTQFKTIGRNMSQGISNGITSSIGSINNSLNKVRNSVNSLSNSMRTYGRNAAQSFSNGFRSIYIPTPHMYISSWRYHNLGDGRSMSTPNFSISWYKAGGLFNQPSIIGVGEAGQEAVLPLENRRTMGMIADSIMSSNNGGIGLSKEELSQAVAEGVAMAMMSNQGNQPNITVYAELRTENDEVLARAVTRGQEKLDYRMRATPK